ncbi:YsnF/AvaK domain-containing protein [Clostridium psychrophilum]|uniref:YsnF/AvaK domain-containing protein n=1 Tax=Clostridium psychrophilum TaxID=132926 RepID=UPI001C0E898B|nr:YsnF/AvaK domain-containing protein [Clostridium psychrophilum]MBU3180385.1 YsnF/AvaK domain-containing protein [Clostridium psychrophilum]
MVENPLKNINSKYEPQINELEQISYNYNKDVDLKIKEEKLDISKEWMQTADVKVYRESITLKKSFTVSVERIELVIENKNLSSDIQDHNDEPKNIIRIPLSEESVEFTKHKVALEDVSIYKQKIEDIKTIETTLKKEQAKIKISDSLKIKTE